MSQQQKRGGRPIKCSRCHRQAPPPDDPERDYWIRVDIHGMQACHAGNRLCGACAWTFLIFLDYTPDRTEGAEFVEVQFERYRQRYGAVPRELGTEDTTKLH